MNPEQKPAIGSEEATAALEQRTHDRAEAVLQAILKIQETRSLKGAIDCPACKGAGALHFRQELRRGRGRSRLVLRAKCTTAECLEFMS